MIISLNIRENKGEKEELLSNKYVDINIKAYDKNLFTISAPWWWQAKLLLAEFLSTTFLSDESLRITYNSRSTHHTSKEFGN